jgi:hypothetical protein
LQLVILCKSPFSLQKKIEVHWKYKQAKRILTHLNVEANYTFLFEVDKMNIYQKCSLFLAKGH